MHHYFPLSQWKITFLSPKQLISLTMLSKLYIPSTINTEKELLRTCGHIKNGLVSGRLACESRNRQNLRVMPIQIGSLKFRMHFHPKNLKGEKNNLWFILLMPIKPNFVCQNISQVCIIVLGIYFLTMPSSLLLFHDLNYFINFTIHMSQWCQIFYKGALLFVYSCSFTRFFHQFSCYISYSE